MLQGKLAKYENPNNSRNNSFPPSKDENWPLMTKSLWEQTGKKPGWLHHNLNRCAAKALPAYELIRNKIANSKIAGTDETGGENKRENILNALVVIANFKPTDLVT